MRIWMPKKKRRSDAEPSEPEAEMVARTSAVRSDEVGAVQFHNAQSLDDLLPHRHRRR